MTLAEISGQLEGELDGNGSITIKGVAKIEDAQPGDITFLANLKYKKYLGTTKASAILIGRDMQVEELATRTTPLHLVRVSDPYTAFLKLVERFHPAPTPLAKGIHPSAVIARSATIGNDVAIGAHVVIGERTRIEDRTTISHGTVLSDDVHIGEDSVLYANVTVREQCIIGKRAIIHSGSVIGSDGFGFAPTADKSYEKIPQRGIVFIEDDVEIGANCTIDRATIGETRICHGAKLDNLIHIAHNVVVGENTVIAAQTGISGSTKIGKNCMIGGQVGIVGHVEIADDIILGAQSGISKSLTGSGKTYFGYPAKELHQSLRIEAALRQLPELIVEVRKLEQRCAELEKTLNHPATTSQQH
jgi:UDP-3-O-[3-hydroxymyristoyl] glucosamine N-acyltransferase